MAGTDKTDYKALMRRALTELRTLKPEVEAARLAHSEPIAIVGLGCRFAGGGNDPESFWRLLAAGEEGISEVPGDRWDVDAYYDPDRQAPGKMCTRRAGFIDDLFGFDARFFDILPNEAATMDPQHRLLLEVSYEALERSNIPVDRLYESRTGVFVGISTYDTGLIQLGGADATNIDPHVGTGSTLSGANGRLSYKLGLTGPSLSVDTACSSSLVAVHYASQSLRRRECDLSIAGGVNAIISPTPSINFSQAGMLAPDGRCKTFDAAADGYVRGEGCGVVVLKRLSDAQRDGDQILALLRGSAVNQNGPSGGLTVPSGRSQETVIRDALAVAGIDPGDVGYVEAHGTGTSLGDPIEVRALAASLCQKRTRDDPLLIGSVKTNIGHCEAAAGVAGLIKTVLSLQHRQIVPHLNFSEPNPHIAWDNLPIEVATRLRPWGTDRKPIAGVSSFGFSGTNAHVVVEAYDEPHATAQPSEAASHYLLPISARTPQALAELAARFATSLDARRDDDLAAVCQTAATGRRRLEHRLALVGRSRAELSDQLASRKIVDQSRVRDTADRGVAFLFTGQGSQYPRMGHDLYRRQPVFRQAMDRCDEILRETLGESIIRLMFDDDATGERLQRTEFAQPALFALEYGLAQLWQAWGIRPTAVVGHSVGEYVAALCANVFDLEQGLRLISARGRLMQGLSGGTMACVFCSEETAAAVVGPFEETVAIAAVNAPELTVISGLSEHVRKILVQFTEMGIEHQQLRVSGAFHSPLVDDLEAEFRAVAQSISYRPAGIPLVTNVTGRTLAAGEILDADYWCRQMRAPVRFFQAMTTLAGRGIRTFVEIGPRPVLTALGRQCLSDSEAVWVSSLSQTSADSEQILRGLGELYVAGAAIDWEAVYAHSKDRRVSLPTYPFEHRSFPIRAPEKAPEKAPQLRESSRPSTTHQESRPETAVITTSTASTTVSQPATPQRRITLETELRAMTQSLTGIPAPEIDAHQNLFSMGFDSITLMRMRQAVENKFRVPVSIKDLSELENLANIAGYLDENLPPDPSEPEPDSAASVSPTAAQVRSGVANGMAGHPRTDREESSELGAIISRQLDLMKSQLELLSELDQSPSESANIPSDPPPTDHRPAEPRPTAARRDGQTSLPYKRLDPSAKGDFSAGRKQVESLVRHYEARTRRSKEMTQKYRPVFANIRNIAGFRPEWKELIYQIMVDKAQGARFTDIDGREYLDITMGFGVYLFGHRPTFVEKAVRESFDSSAPIGPMCPDAGEVARLIHEMTGADRVAFFNTGSEAVMSALRIARAVTRRPKVVMFSGSYHGHTDNLLATGVNGETLPMVPGTPQRMVEDTWVLTYGDQESIDFIAANSDQIAAVLVEPVQSRRPDFQPTEFLHKLRDVTEQGGTALIFDEVILGFRTHPGGAQAWFDIEADIVTYGKAIGGGMPIGVVAGKSRFLDAIDGGMWRYGDDSVPPVENTFIAGTFNHHPLAMAAARAVLEHLKAEGPELQERLNQRTADLARRLDAVFEKAGVPIRVVHFGSLFRFQLHGEWELFCYHMVARGIYIWEGRNCFLSTAHTDDDLDFLVRAVEETIDEMLQSQAALRKAEPVAIATTRHAPLSAGQYRLFVQAQSGGELAYHVPIALTVDGPLDMSRLRQAVAALAQRHEALRTGFSMDGDEPAQVLHARTDIPIETLAVGEQSIDDVLAAFIRPFDLEQPPLLRVGVAGLADDRHLLVFDAHHIVFDGISGSILFEDFLRLYHGETPPAPKKTFRDYIDMEASYRQTQAYTDDEAYWTECFDGTLEAVNLPTDRPRPARKSYAGLRIFRRVDHDRTRALKQLASTQRTTLNVVLLAAHFSLLSKLSGARDFAVGTAFDGRPEDAYGEVLGTFVNTIAVRGKPAASKPLGAFIAELKQSLLEASDHQRYPYEALVDSLDLPRDANRNPFFDTLFVYEQLPTSTITAGDLTFCALDVRNRTAILDITHDVVEVDGSLNMSMEFDTDLFDRETVERFLDYYVAVLDGFVAPGATDRPLGHIALLDEEQRTRQLHAFNATQKTLPEETFVHLFEASVENHPDRPALIIGDDDMTYAELNERANRLAHLLIKSGVGPEAIVCLAVDRSAATLVAVLAVLKAGGAYLPVDRQIPMQRFERIVDDAEPVLLLCSSEFAERVVDGLSTIALDSPFADEMLADMPAANPTDTDRAQALTLSVPAYVIYTSGSTGSPKGVVVTHAGLPALAGSHIAHLQVTPQSRILQFAALTFDAAVAEIVTAWAAGAALVLLSEEQRVGEALLDEIVMRGVTHVTVPPVVLSTFPADARLPVECLALAGEACSAELVDRWSSECRVFNIYGPTEASVAVTMSDALTGKQTPPIGLPIWNMRAYVLDADLEPVPPGVAGDLYLAGDGLARGYLNQPALTAEKFVLDPHAESAGSRMYRTGDLARRRNDGQIEFVGRADDQLKIRGYRIEPGEIQAALLMREDIAHAAVIARENAAGERELAGYIVSVDGEELNTAEIRRALGDVLPDYMIPSVISQLDALPLTRNGKLDRARLPVLENDVEQNGVAFEGPRNEIQQALVEVWQQVLGREKVSIHDNFFNLSGDSIKALQVVIRMQQRGYRLRAKDLFDHSELAELSTRVAGALPEVDQAPVQGEIPLTPVQAWFAGQELEEEHYYNQSVCLKAGSPVSEEALRATLSALQDHHDALRMRFERRGGTLIQENRDLGMPVSLSVVDLTGAGDDWEAELASAVRSMQADMDLDGKPLMQARLCRLGKEDSIVIAIHHLVVDAVSWRVLLEDLATGYRQFIDRGAIKYPAKTRSYAEWSRQLQDLARRGAFNEERGHWHDTVMVDDDLPRTRPGLHEDAQRLTCTLAGESFESVAAAARSAGISVEALLLTSLARLLRRCVGESHILLTLEHHGRSDTPIEIDVARTVGWFTSHYPLRMELSRSDESPEQDLQQIRQVLAQVPNRGIGYGVLRYLEGDEVLKKGQRPQVLFNYLGEFTSDPGGGLFEIVPEGSGSFISPGNRRDHELEAEAVFLSDGLELSLVCDSAGYHGSEPQALMAAWEQEVRIVAASCQAKDDMPAGPDDPEFPGAEPDQLKAILEATALGQAEVSAVYPLSPLQEGMLFHKLADEASAMFINQFGFKARGALNVNRFQQSWNGVIARHEALRARFVSRGIDQPAQVIVRHMELPLHHEDLREMDSAMQKERIEAFRREDRAMGFDLACDPLIRIAVFQTAEHEFDLVLSFHHILFDGWCMVPMFLEMIALYRGLAADKSPSLPAVAPYENYVNWLQTLDKDSSKAYWQDYLRGFTRPTGLPRSSDPTGGSQRQALHFDLDREHTRRLGALLAQQRITLSSLLRVVWAVLLGKHSGSDDVVFGVLVSGRPAELPGADEMVGMFINTVPLRVRMDPETELVELARRLQGEWLNAERHQYLSLADVQAVSEPGSELLDHVMVIENYPLADGLPHIQKELDGLFSISDVDFVDQANYPLMIEAHPGDALQILLSFDASVFSISLMEEVRQQFRQILTSLCDAPESRVSDVQEQLMSEAERQERDAFARSLQSVNEEF